MRLWASRENLTDPIQFHSSMTCLLPKDADVQVLPRGMDGAPGGALPAKLSSHSSREGIGVWMAGGKLRDGPHVLLFMIIIYYYTKSGALGCDQVSQLPVRAQP